MREAVNPNEIFLRPDDKPNEITKEMYFNLAIPSFTHGYSLGIEYMKKWFESKFDKDFFKGGVYVDAKHVLDDYKSFNNKELIKRINPKARIGCSVEYDYDRETLDSYLQSPEIFLRKSTYQNAFFIDYDRNIFLGVSMRALRMNFTFKVRLNTRAQQFDTYQKMEMAFRVGSTQYEYASADFHVPKNIILNIADRAGFEIKNHEVVDILDFLKYLNLHSELPFTFKLRALNQKPEYFIRLRDLYTHIAVRDKLSLDDGERDGKLDYNFNIEMNAVLTMPIPHFYTYYSAKELVVKIPMKEAINAVAVYSFNAFEDPNVDENGWNLAATTDCLVEKGDTEMDLSPLFSGDNLMARCINHTMTQGVSPYKYINIKLYRGDDVAITLLCKINWDTKVIDLGEEWKHDEMIHIAIYYDRDYMNNIEIELNNYNSNRIAKDK